MFCTNCGTEVSAPSKFCTNCGARVLAPASGSDYAAEPSSHTANLLDYVRHNVNSPALIGAAHLVSLLIDADAPMSATEWGEILSFTEEQYCRWHVRWLFSPAQSPDAVAQDEQERWKRVYDAVVIQMTEAIPALGDVLFKRLSAKLTSDVLHRKAEVDEVSAAGGAVTSLKMTIGHGLNALGARKLAKSAINSAIFPRGSVGSLLQREE